MNVAVAVPSGPDESGTDESGTDEPGRVVDGRRRRAARGRDAVVDALLALYDEGHLRPGVALIAERAGVSQSSVFRYFQDVDDLVRTAIDHQWERLRDHFTPPSSDGSLDQRIASLVEQRLRIYDVAGPALRSARLVAPESPTLHAVFAFRREMLRDQLAAQFAPELTPLPPARRDLVLDALDLATGLEQVESLRIDRGVDAVRATAVMSLMVRAVLT